MDSSYSEILERMPGETAEFLNEPAGVALPAKAAEGDTHEDLREAAQMIARQEVSDAIATAMAEYPGSSHDFHRETGIDPAVISRLIRGYNKQGATVATLAHIALALGKTLRITID